MSVIVLRVRGGLDFSHFILDEELVGAENMDGEVQKMASHPTRIERKVTDFTTTLKPLVSFP